MASLEEDKKLLMSVGKCASCDGHGHLCVLTANHARTTSHLAQIIGGPEDGKVLAEWPW